MNKEKQVIITMDEYESLIHKIKVFEMMEQEKGGVYQVHHPAFNNFIRLKYIQKDDAIADIISINHSLVEENKKLKDNNKNILDYKLIEILDDIQSTDCYSLKALKRKYQIIKDKRTFGIC